MWKPNLNCVKRKWRSAFKVWTEDSLWEWIQIERFFQTNFLHSFILSLLILSFLQKHNLSKQLREQQDSGGTQYRLLRCLCEAAVDYNRTNIPFYMIYLVDISIGKQILTLTGDLQCVFMEYEEFLLFTWTGVGVPGCGLWPGRCGWAPCGLWVGSGWAVPLFIPCTVWGGVMNCISWHVCTVCVSSHCSNTVVLTYYRVIHLCKYLFTFSISACFSRLWKCWEVRHWFTPHCCPEHPQVKPFHPNYTQSREQEVHVLA